MEISETYLAHHGIKGQKWGVRRYQNADGSLTTEGRKRKGLGEPRKSLFSKKKKEEKTEAEKKEELKEYLRKHPKKLVKYSKELTKQEAEEVISNIQFDRRLRDIRQQEIDRGLEKIKSVTNTMQTVTNALNTGKNVYNAYVDVHNSFTTGKKFNKIGEAKKDDRSGIERIIRTGSAQEIYDNRGKLTSKELADAVARLNYEDRLKDRLK